MRGVPVVNDYLPYIIFGLTTGSIYGISAMGLVLTYKTSGLFNIAHGATSAVGAYAFYAMRQSHGVPWPVAFVIAVLVLGPLSGLVLERMAVLLDGVTTTFKVVASVGLLVAIQASVGIIYGNGSTFSFDPFLSQAEVFSINGVRVSFANVVYLVLGIGLAAALALLFSRTRMGMEMRGVVDDPTLMSLTGVAPTRIRRKAWMVGSTFAALTGVLFAASQQQVGIAVLSLLVVQAFGAAAIGRFTSLPLAFAGGIIVGLLQQIAAKAFGPYENMQGLSLNVPFLVLFLILLFAKKNQFVEVGRQVKQRADAASSFSPRTRMLGYGALLAVALAIPHLWFVGSHLPAYLTAMTNVVLFLSLGLLVRTSGQISLCHIAFAAIGAASFGHFLGDGMPWGVAILLGAGVVVPVAAFIAIPAIRLSGLYLALASLGFGILVAQFAYGKSFMFGFGQITTRRPEAFGFENDENFYYLLLGVAVLTAVLVASAERARLGRLLRAMSDSPIAVTTLGLNLSALRVMVFCLSGFLAGLSGALYASLFGSVNQDSFTYDGSLVVLAVLAIAGRRTITAAVTAAVLLDVVPNYIDDERMNFALQLAFGVFAIAAAAASQGDFRARIAALTAASQGRRISTTADRRAWMAHGTSEGSPRCPEPQPVA